MKRVVVIGNGMVGQRFLEALVKEAPGRFAVEVLCEEPRLAYDRVQLSDSSRGKSAADLALTDERFFRRHDIAVRLNSRALAIDRVGKRVSTADGAELSYDKLVIATGSYPFVPPLPGRDRPQCFVYRTIEDLEAIRAAGAPPRSAPSSAAGCSGWKRARR